MDSWSLGGSRLWTGRRMLMRMQVRRLVVGRIRILTEYRMEDVVVT